MRWPFVSRRRHDAELAAAKADSDRLREERDDARTERAAFRSAAQISARQFTEADATNRRLSGRVLELGRRLSSLGEADPEHTARLERRITRLRTGTSRILAAYRTEQRRADHLQRRLDDAVGIPAGEIKDSRPWQPAYQKPKQEETGS